MNWCSRGRGTSGTILSPLSSRWELLNKRRILYNKRRIRWESTGEKWHIGNDIVVIIFQVIIHLDQCCNYWEIFWDYFFLEMIKGWWFFSVFGEGRIDAAYDIVAIIFQVIIQRKNLNFYLKFRFLEKKNLEFL